jgi:L-cysteine S-thiosulfotransferase
VPVPNENKEEGVMKKTICITLVSALLTPVVAFAQTTAVELDALKIMQNPNTGNCTACHSIPAEPKIVAGDMGPPFIGMKDRFPDIAKLRAAVAEQKNISPQTLMPPFERNKILTAEQIDSVVKFIYQY